MAYQGTEESSAEKFLRGPGHSESHEFILMLDLVRNGGFLRANAISSATAMNMLFFTQEAVNLGL